MNCPGLKTRTQKSAFTLVEGLLVVSVIVVLAFIAFVTITNVKPAAELSKIRSDVQNLNTAIKLYQNSGGDLSGASTPGAVIAKLKTVRQKSTANTYVGFTGSVLDPRVSLRTVDESYHGPRAVYDSDNKKFLVTTDPVAGFKLELGDLDDPGMNEIEETRADSALKYSATSTWVWDYQDAAIPAHLNPTLVTKINPSTPPPTPPSTIEDPEAPPAPELNKLDPPTFSLPTDYYNLPDFPFTVSLSNPNPDVDSKIVYGLINSDEWEWQDYVGPISVSPGQKLLAYVESLTPQEFHHSDPSSELYNWTTQLETPEISVSVEEIEARTGSTTITITTTNHPEYLQYGEEQLEIPAGSFDLEYKLVPLVPGEGTETDWVTYNEPFHIGGPQFPHGFQVLARSQANGPHFSSSSVAIKDVTAYYTLDPPTIASSLEILTSNTEVADITITNPNPNGSSDLTYQILDDDGIDTTGWLDYTSTFQVAASDYPRGFTVVARATSTDGNSYYRDSEDSEKTISVHFFEIEVTGKTIFILDSSGSMRTNDRMDRLRDATLAVIGILDDDDSYALIDYDSSATVLMPWGPASEERAAQSQAAIQAMEAGGGTNYELAILAGLGLNANGADQVIFLSDGFPNPEPDDNEDILVLVDQFLAQGIVRFDTVALGSSREILGLMAARGNGTETVVPDE